MSKQNCGHKVQTLPNQGTHHTMLFSTGQAQLDLQVHMGARGYEIGAMCSHTRDGGITEQVIKLQ